MEKSFPINLAVWYVIFLFSATLHEASHALTASYGGDDTSYRAGQASMNPFPHIQREKFGMVVMPLLSFFLNGGNWMIGWASAPFNPYWAARYPRRSFAMSLAGPMSHLFPATLAWLGMYIGLRTGFFHPPSHPEDLFPVSMGYGGGLSWGLAMLLNVMFQLNAILLVFNLMPFPPLDGSEVWYLFIKSEESRLRWRYTSASYSFAGILLAWYLFPNIFEPLFRMLIRALYSGVQF